jgi:hypothetical protein
MNAALAETARPKTGSPQNGYKLRNILLFR